MKKLPVLNGLRGVAIVGVVFHHSFYAFFANPALPLTPLTVVASSGWLGVNLFFFLSGFVLFLPYATDKRKFDGRDSVITFYKHRAIRLLPLYYTSTFVLLLLASPHQLGDISLYRAFVDYLFATFVYRRVTFFPAENWVLWSLGVELWFSLLFPIIVIAINRYGWRKVLPFVILLALSVRIAGHAIVLSDPRRVLNYISDSVFGRVDEFAFGMLGAHLFATRRMLARPALQLAAGLFLICASATLWTMWSHGSFAPQTAALFTIPMDIGFLVATNALLVGCATASRALSVWPLQMLGLMCYSLYIWHAPLIAHFRASAYTVPTYTAYLGATVLIAWLSYRYIEFGSVSDFRKLLPTGRSEAAHRTVRQVRTRKASEMER
jgi:peptidoglycan/LPS O-acetylase OafA/YrhL